MSHKDAWHRPAEPVLRQDIHLLSIGIDSQIAATDVSKIEKSIEILGLVGSLVGTPQNDQFLLRGRSKRSSKASSADTCKTHSTGSTSIVARILYMHKSAVRDKMAVIMVITHHGGQCFKVTFGDLTLVFDPVAKGGTLPPVRFGADIALVSRNHPDTNGILEVTYGEKEPFSITGPGEYEKGGVSVQGFLTKSRYGLTKGETEALNTIYAVKLEGMTLVHLGALSDTQLPPEAKEAIDEIDILFIPVGGDGVLDAGEAAKLSTMLEPRIIIPMHWSGMGTSKALETYLKEEGGATEKVEKLTLKKKDALDKDGDIIVINP